MNSMGTLVVNLAANIASFSSDLGKAVTMAEASMNKIKRAAMAWRFIRVRYTNPRWLSRCWHQPRRAASSQWIRT